MRPGFFDIVAAFLSAAICITVLNLAQDAGLRIDRLIGYSLSQQPQYSYNPYGGDRRYQPRQQQPVIQRPAPPPIPYTLADCESDFRSISTNQDKNYLSKYCECFTPQRAAIGAKNLTERQENQFSQRLYNEIIPQCQDKAISTFIGMSNLDEKFRNEFNLKCRKSPIQYFSQDDRGKAEDLCQCLGVELEQNRQAMTSIVLGASSQTERATTQNLANICYKRVFPPIPTQGWQVSTRLDGRSTAVVKSNSHELISQINLGCSETGQLKLAILWRKKPIRDQIIFLGGDSQEDVIIPLKSGVTQGVWARKFYDQVVFWQGILKKDGMDLDITEFGFQAIGDEVGDKQGIILGDTKTRLKPMLEACETLRNKAANQNNSAPKAPETMKKTDKKSQCIAQAKKINDAYKNIRARIPTGMHILTNNICNLRKFEIQTVQDMAKNIRECSDVIKYGDLQNDISSLLQALRQKYQSDCSD